MDKSFDNNFKRSLFRSFLYCILIPITPLIINFYLMPFMISKLDIDAFGL